VADTWMNPMALLRCSSDRNEVAVPALCRVRPALDVTNQTLRSRRCIKLGVGEHANCAIAGPNLAHLVHFRGPEEVVAYQTVPCTSRSDQMSKKFSHVRGKTTEPTTTAWSPSLVNEIRQRFVKYRAGASRRTAKARTWDLEPRHTL
jgi:hypothetical protein